MTDLADAVQTSLHTTKRTLRQGRYQAEDLQAAAVGWVRRSPDVAIGVAFAAGVVAALAMMQGARTLRTRPTLEES